MFTRERLTRWTAALRANPEQQERSRLTNDEGTKFCCLGKLCMVEGLERVIAKESAVISTKWGFKLPGVEEPERFGLVGQLATDLYGPGRQQLSDLGMPFIRWDGETFNCLITANDGVYQANRLVQVPWPVIADHLDKYYPCSDEQQPKE